VFSQGDPADAVFYIHDGGIKLSVVSKAGKEAVTGILGPGSFLGEHCLGKQAVRGASAMAIAESRVERLEKRLMVDLLRAEPAFAEFFLAHLLTRTTRIEEDLADQIFNPSEKRLARLLLLLANFDGDGAPEPAIPRISQETLAEAIGTTRSRVSFFMNKFRKQGFIKYNGMLEVHSSLRDVIRQD
jgi:CRP-like cAMP-binding protein